MPAAQDPDPALATPAPVSLTLSPLTVIAESPIQALPAQYVDFFQRFNRGEYFAAHEILEELWLQDRRGPSGDYFKGLIQIAGAFVHLEKGRLQPGQSLLKLARANLEKYPPDYLRWSVAEGLLFIGGWLQKLVAEASISLLPLPRLQPPGGDVGAG